MWGGTYELVYKMAINCVRSVRPSFSSAALSMNGWFDGHSERFGSARFCNCTRSIQTSSPQRLHLDITSRRKHTRGSCTKRVCTNISRWTNLSAAMRTPRRAFPCPAELEGAVPAPVAGLSTKSRMRRLEMERMSHGWRFAVRDVHLR